MIIKTPEFKKACRTILYAINTKESTLFTETLELKTVGDVLKLNVTDRSYYVTVEFKLEHEEQFHAAVNASLFLKLISKLTTDTIDLVKEGNNIKIRSNGEYKLPIIFNNNVMLELPTIEVNNVTSEMTINGSILNSILKYNSKELMRGVAVKPVQNYYYIDELGAITFTSGACVNSFTLERPIRLLLDSKVVNLFKLFKEDELVSFKMGQDELSENLIQTKVEFKSSDVTLTTVLRDVGLVSSVPVQAIRNMANKNYTYSVVVNRLNLLDAIQRILLFDDNNIIASISFTKSNMIIADETRDNKEVIKFENDCPNLESYQMKLILNNLKLILDGCEDEYVTIRFGDSKAVVIKKANVSDIIPELTR